MALNNKLEERCNSVCELCNNATALHEYTVTPKFADSFENMVALCNACFNALSEQNKGEHWRCLEGAIWNPEPSVQALSYRLLNEYKTEDWAADVLSSVELDENIVQWAMSAFEVEEIHKDAFGTTLENGDTIVLTQNLNVKGTNFTAPKGTVVKKIRLVPNNTEQIEGKINEQVIVILTKYVKKS